LGVAYDDFASTTQRLLPRVEIVRIDSIRSFFAENADDLDGLIISAEEGAAWNVLYPEHAVVVPRPVLQRPVGMAVRLADSEWLGFLNRWLDFERMDGSLQRLRTYWVEGGGTQQQPRRWSIMQDEIHWLP
jgi:ABC-type amino acid transport substrate-binding protein